MKTLRRILTAVLLALALGIGALWAWAGSEGSLATALQQLTRFLPTGQTLEARDVSGALRSGGRIGALRWQHDAISVEVRDLAANWNASGWREAELRLSRLAIGHLRIEDRSAATAPPTEWLLPLRLDVPFTIAALEWAGPGALQITQLTGHYGFDGQTHRLDAGSAQIAAGNYRLSGSLQARAPMHLSAQVQGSVQTALPGAGQPVRATAQATVQGQLAGGDATLALQAELVPEGASAMQAQVTASLQPWQPQTIVSATAQWQALDLAALWPQAPQTLLAGTATVTPSAAGWHADVALRNAQAGPWNQQRLPLQSVQAALRFTQGQWTLDSLQASAGGGRIQAQGQLAPTDSDTLPVWQGQATLQGVNPAALDSRLKEGRLDGRLSAQQTPSGTAFAADLQSVDAQLQAQFTLARGTPVLQGQLRLNLPGASAKLNGQIAASQGLGDVDLQISDAAQASRWLKRWTAQALLPEDAQIDGGIKLSGQWQGGWQGQGRDLRVTARLQSEQLTLRSAGQSGAQGWRVQALAADISGALSAWKLKAQGELEQAGQRFALATQAQGARDAAGVWQAEIESAQLTARDQRVPGNWTLQLAHSVALRWGRDAKGQTLSLGEGSARLSAPLPGQALISWQPARWSQQGQHSSWQTQGALQGLPLAWLDQWAQSALAQTGIGGDLLLGGQWQASAEDAALQVRATLARASGDLLLQTGDAAVGTLRAGLDDAQLLLTAQGEQVAAKLSWRSEHAGQAQAEFSSRLTRQNARWDWPLDAPLRGTLQAQLPPLADWSRLAPPGWRLRGTLQAQAELSGTRGAPQWHGTLGAQDLALSSVVEGIDFSQGTLRAKLDGQRLEILAFSFAGAGNTGTLSGTGSLDWPSAGAPAATLRSRLRMALDVQANALRVSSMADRRLLLSGQLAARLEASRLTLRGKLRADQALFVLSEDTAPRLGEDVLLRKPTATARSSTSSATAPDAQGMGVRPDIAVSLDLGPRFQVRGHGLVTRLSGQLELRSGADPTHAPRLHGDLRALGGTYNAYGQQLNIEQGVLRFDGPYDNPALDILAIRPQLQQRVGVRISGNALSPIVRLYADPDLPDAEKLSWLLLGRSPANGGSEAAVLQQAALSLLGGDRAGVTGGLANALGLDQLALGNNTGETTVTLGKNLARNFYVAYERGLSSALGSFSIFYELSRRFTLRARTGEQSALDLIFTLRYD